eukprot:3152096-Pyramimonas_sp.AAC.1
MATVEKLVVWLRSVVSELAHHTRVLPLIRMDLNDGIGIGMKEGRWRYTETSVAREELSTKEMMVGGAGEQ